MKLSDTGEVLLGKIPFLAYEISFSDVSEILPVCLRNNLSENLLPYGDREVGQDFADFVYEIYSDDFCQHFVAYFAFHVGVLYLMIRGS